MGVVYARCIRRLFRVPAPLRLRPSLKELLRSSGVIRLAPAFAVAAVIGALIDILILATLAQAAVALTTGKDQAVVSGALSMLSGFTPGELVLIGLGLCVLRLGPYVVAAEVPARLAARLQEDLRI